MFSLHDATFWAMTAASLFNVILMATLGLSVLLTAPRRGLGATLAGLGLTLGAAFFAAHAALLDYDLKALILGVRSWWFFGWSALIALPGAWYALMLWYGGFWDDAASRLHRAHRAYFVGALLTALFLTALIVWIDPAQLLRGAAQMMISGAPPLREYSREKPENVGIALFAIYAIYAVSCLGLSLDVVRRPAPSARLMGDVARRRARPWLVATTLLLLLVSALFGGGLSWLMLYAARGELADFGVNSVGGVLWSLDWFDALVCALVGASVVTLGKALVSYDLFATGALPRSGLWRQWRRVVAVAALVSALLALALTVNLRPIYLALLATLSLSGAFALLQWRAMVEREQTLSQMRSLFQGADAKAPDDESPKQESPNQENVGDATFATLCRDVLNASRAHLLPLNTLAPLAGEPLHFPRAAKLDARVLAAATAPPLSPATLCFALDEKEVEAPCWAVPLWSARGAIGVLLLAEKNGGALYTHEEMEMARTVCERLLDVRAGAALSQRLIELQQRKLSESFVIDNRARRTLHDDVLPQLHAAMLTLGAASTRANANSSHAVAPKNEDLARDTRGEESDAPRDIAANRASPANADFRERAPLRDNNASTRTAEMQTRDAAETSREHAATSDAEKRDANASTRMEESAPDVIQMLADAHRQISDLLHAMPPLTAPRLSKLGFRGALLHVVQRELPNAFESVEWNTDESACASLDAMAELRREVVFYAAREAIRNAARHARRESRQSLHLKIAIIAKDAEVAVFIEDNGCGMAHRENANREGSTREYSQEEEDETAPRGGHGLALHSTLMAVIGGALSLENAAPHGTRVVLTVKTNG